MKNLILIITVSVMFSSCSKDALYASQGPRNINIRYDDVQSFYNMYAGTNTGTTKYNANGGIIADNIDYVVILCPEVAQYGNVWNYTGRVINVAISVSQLKSMLSGHGFGVDQQGQTLKFATVYANSNGSWYAQKGHRAYYVIE